MSSTKKKLKFLVVDDIFTNRLLLTEILKEIGYDCQEAENGSEALDCFTNDDFDMILMDIEMPVMNGIEATRKIRELEEIDNSKVPIIAMTAHNPGTYFNNYSDAGFDQLVTKPYSIAKISSVIEKVCGENVF
jgi:CheY-like chemotaxis protein